jgi:hypothetical protein
MSAPVEAPQRPSTEFGDTRLASAPGRIPRDDLAVALGKTILAALATVNDCASSVKLGKPKGPVSTFPGFTKPREPTDRAAMGFPPPSTSLHFHRPRWQGRAAAAVENACYLLVLRG